MTQDGHILWPVIDTNMGSILIHDNIQPPMQLILDMSMRTNPLCKCLDLRRATADEIACFCSIRVPICRSVSTMPMLCRSSHASRVEIHERSSVTQYRRVSIRPWPFSIVSYVERCG